jgi:hypothetical protein
MAVQHVLDLGGIYVVAAADDEFLDPADDQGPLALSARAARAAT